MTRENLANVKGIFVFSVSFHHQPSIIPHGDVSQGAEHTALGIQKHPHLDTAWGCIEISFY